jgi:hypothetical protein
MGIGALVAAGVGVAAAAGSVASSSIAANKQEKIAKSGLAASTAAAQAGLEGNQAVSEQVEADQNIASRNLRASEQARLNVFASLGTPGSYGPSPGSQSGPIQFQGLTPTGLGGMSSYGNSITSSGAVFEAGQVGDSTWDTQGTVLDPDKMTAAVQGTSGFRQVSQMVAEAEQLMNRTGPLWDQLNNSIVGGIYESNAGFQREAMEQVARQLARGGGTRRIGLQMAQAFQVQEKINRQRTGQLWQAKMGLEQYRIAHSKDTMEYAQKWVNNTSGIRDAFTNATQNLQLFWASTMAPTLAGATTAAASATQQGILQASGAMQDANNTRSQAISGALEGITGSATKIIGLAAEDKWGK